ncbi:MAG: histidinol-phosphate aminotransferase [Alteromonadaceae bacterium]|nr:MAG: histidinol-phosphate aminotransferase [Alteromonadaceae bacterium]
MSVFKSHIVAMSAYLPPLEGRNPDSHLLLDFNERTLPVSDEVRDALLDYINGGRMQMYPCYEDITDRIADYVGVEAGNVMITNGSDQGIDLVFRATCNPSDEAIIPHPGFAMYNQCAKIENLDIITPIYTMEHGFPVQEVIAAITNKTKMICFANPNNPSGTGVRREDIIQLLEAAPNAAVLVDECYYEYSKNTVVDLVEQYPNLIVTRTFSKTWGIPSLRMGYLIAAKQNINALLNVRGPYDINQLAVVAVRAALEAPGYMEAYIKEVMEESKPALEAFLSERNIDFWPSEANFVWMFSDQSEAIEKQLLEAGILVRPKFDADGRRGLRITLGTKEQTDRVLGEMAKVV